MLERIYITRVPSLLAALLTISTAIVLPTLNPSSPHPQVSLPNEVPNLSGVRADPVLAAHGITQTKQLTKHILSIPHLPQKIYSSPYYRCIQTISPLAKALNLPIYLDEGIAEWYGQLHLQQSPDHPTPLSPDRWSGFFEGVEFRQGETGIVPSRRGETMEEIHKRTKRALERIIETADKEGVKCLILCTHAATNIALGRALTGDPEMDVRTGTASLGEYVRIQEQGKGSSGIGDLGLWNCLRNGDSKFLSDGEERNWWFDGDIPGDDPDVTALYADTDSTTMDTKDTEENKEDKYQGIENKSKL